MERLLSTDPTNRMLLVQRLVLAGVMLPHGLQKLFGWMGGYGWDGTMGYLTGTIGLPAPLAAALIVFEGIGPLLLAGGLATRLAGLGFTVVMIGAIVTAHAPYGFFMDWGGQLAGEGFEYHILALGLSVPLAIAGGGAAALDTVLERRRRARPAAELASA